MAKKGISIELTTFDHTDPLTGKTKTFWRKAHNNQTSRRLKEFQKCVGSQMYGFHASGATREERIRSLRDAFTNAAKSCAGH